MNFFFNEFFFEFFFRFCFEIHLQFWSKERLKNQVEQKMKHSTEQPRFVIFFHLLFKLKRTQKVGSLIEMLKMVLIRKNCLIFLNTNKKKIAMIAGYLFTSFVILFICSTVCLLSESENQTMFSLKENFIMGPVSTTLNGPDPCTHVSFWCLCDLFLHSNIPLFLQK